MNATKEVSFSAQYKLFLAENWISFRIYCLVWFSIRRRIIFFGEEMGSEAKYCVHWVIVEKIVSNKLF